jgi:hypothetical protein
MKPVFIENQRVTLLESDGITTVLVRSPKSTPGIRAKFDVTPYKTYRITITARCDAAKPPELWIGDANCNVIEFINIGINAEFQTFTYNFYNRNNSVLFVGLLFRSCSKDDKIHIKSLECVRKIFNDRIYASLASIPLRKNVLQSTVNSILPHVDHLHVYLNNYDAIPHFLLNNPKITVAQSQQYGDNGDAGKFWWSNNINGYHFVLDDDLIYSQKFFDLLIEKLLYYDNKVVVGIQGATVISNMDKFVNYYKSRTSYHHNMNLTKDTVVHILGTGVLCYHTTIMKVYPTDFKHPNMADIWFGLLGQQNKIPFLCVEHGSNNLITHADIDLSETIFFKSRNDKKSPMNSLEMQNTTIKDNSPWVHNYFPRRYKK